MALAALMIDQRRPAVIFTLIAIVLAWLVVLPLWLSDKGLRHPLAGVLLMVMMTTPAIAVFITNRIVRGGRLRDTTGLRLGARGWWRYWIFCWLAFPIFCLAAPFVAALFGLYPLDLVEFSGFLERLVAAGGGIALDRFSIQALVAIQIGSVLFAPLLNAPLALGEELGWRGYLLPRLLPLGQIRALVISGVLWGVWHAPIILLGYNYPNAPVQGVLQMILFCILIGIILGWTRIATGSVWPAVIGHGALNGAAGLIGLFHRAGAHVDPTLVGITGITGMILPALLIAGLVVTRRLPVPGKNGN